MEKNNNRKNPFLDTIDSDSSKNDGNNGVNIYPKEIQMVIIALNITM